MDRCDVSVSQVPSPWVPMDEPNTSDPLALLRRMYPSPNQITSAPIRCARTSYVALPTSRTPRLLADARSPDLVARVVRGHGRASPLPVHVARVVLSAAVRRGLGRRLPGVTVSIHGSAEAASILDPLREVLGVADIRLAMSFGPQRANRKPVLQVVDAGGVVLAFAKIGHNDLTKNLVQREAQCLRQLSEHAWSEVIVPQVLGLTHWRDLTVLVLSPLDLSPKRKTGAAARDKLMSVIDEIGVVSGCSIETWSRSVLRARLIDRLSVAGRLGEPWLALLRKLPGELPLTTGSWHGDLNPGNVALTSGRCPVWDWERYEIHVPLGFDVLHHDLQQALTRKGTKPIDAALGLLQDAPRVLARWGHNKAQADLVSRAYLITLADRYLTDDQENAGARIGAVNNWLLPAFSAGPS